MKKVYQIRQEDFDRILENAKFQYYNMEDTDTEKSFQLAFMTALKCLKIWMHDLTIGGEDE